MIATTHGIVLRIYPFSRTSHMVSWLTPDQGRLTTVVKGACRPKSPFLGQYDLFYGCEMLYYTRERAGGVHVLRECTPLQRRESLRTDWRATACASYLCRLACDLSQPAHPCPDLHALLAESLGWLTHHGATPSLLLWSELRAMRSAGLSPNLTPCRHLAEAPTAAHRFSIPDGRLVCPRCAPPGTAHTVALPPDLIARLRRWQGAEQFSTVVADPLPQQGLGFRRFLGIFMGFHLEDSLKARQLAWQMLEADDNV